MAPDYGYSCGQGRTIGASSSNNTQFQIVNKWLCEMAEKKVFEKFGLEIYNTYQNSGLRAFPYAPFDAALDDVTKSVEETPNLSGWYEKTECPKCKSWHIHIASVNRCMDCKHEWNNVEMEDVRSG
jgi:hypothetical protein